MDDWLLADFDSIQQSFLKLQKTLSAIKTEQHSVKSVQNWFDLENHYVNFKLKLPKFKNEHLKLSTQRLYDSDWKILTSALTLMKNSIDRQNALLSHEYSEYEYDAAEMVVGDDEEMENYGEIVDNRSGGGSDARNLNTDDANLVDVFNYNVMLERNSAHTNNSLTGVDSASAKVIRFNQFETPEENKLHSELAMNPTNVDSVYDEIIKYGNGVKLDSHELSLFEYRNELNMLLSMPIPDLKIESGVDLNINKYSCAGIVAKAFFLNNISNLSFRSIKAAALVDNVYKVKLFCILQYITNICRLIREDMQYYNEDVVVQIVDCEDQSVLNSKRVVYLNRIKICLADYSENVSANSFETNYGLSDLVMMYVDSETGLNATDAAINQKSIQFLEFPEMFAVAHYANNRFDQNQILLVSNVYKVNNLKVMPSGDIIYAGNSFVTHQVTNTNIMIVTMNKQRFVRGDTLGVVVVDENYLREEINKLLTGFKIFSMDFVKSEDAADNDRQLNTLFSGSYGEAYSFNYAFRFLAECAAAMECGFCINYCVKNEELYNELLKTKNVLTTFKKFNVGHLYTVLQKYEFTKLGSFNFT
ncbi:pagr [Euproctis pseudoconspersa nucleopolyhedrovirus]|uniref:Pagr n=1 Tax=Euproctis pseudoconspersa nucleopolyhedrovirus TaxID=307467 RepID=C3TX09_9ABAC|nr:pagr [Euproctis pseudoconspersa nucleopolyhedrovirus]ACO53551.1 pagr [Euproctis pseudoconspersa nucleopolyhedrovirus]